jgi:hypothetical protein
MISQSIGKLSKDCVLDLALSEDQTVECWEMLAEEPEEVSASSKSKANQGHVLETQPSAHCGAELQVTLKWDETLAQQVW